MSESIRLDSLLSQRGYCARRKVQDFLSRHVVTLDGTKRLQQPGLRVEENANIYIDGKKIKQQVKKIYLALYKPEGYLSSLSDKYCRPLAVDLIPQSRELRLYNVGRLDFHSCGLLLFTNDGLWAEKMMHPRYEIEKEYEVFLNKPVTKVMLNAMRESLYIGDQWLRISSYKIMQDPLHIKMTLKEGKNREIRRIFMYFGLRVTMLKRVRIDSILLGNMQPGEVRRLSAREVEIFNKK